MRLISDTLFQLIFIAILFADVFLGGFAVVRADSSADEQYQKCMSTAMAADANQDLASALTSYIEALQAVPDSDSPKSDIARMVTNHGMPRRLTAEQVAEINKNPLPFELRTVDSGLMILTLSGVPGSSVDSLNDPQNGWPFPALAAIYAPASDVAGSMKLVCAVHYQTINDRDFAEHVGRLLALLQSVLELRTGRLPSYENAFNVWLSRSSATSPGGEQWRNNIYLYDLDDGRSSIEWIREIAHEYGHLAIPPIGGEYTSPEAWANGYVGERLMVRWLADPQLAGPQAVENAWGRTFSGYPNFESKLIDPPLALFITHGLDNTWLDHKDESGMRYLIGMLLWVDQTKGGKALGDLLWNSDSPDPNSLYAPVKMLVGPGPPKSITAVQKNHARRNEI